MTIPVGTFSNLLTGLATALQTANLGTYSTSTAYTALQTGIVLGTFPDKPDRVICLTAYMVDDDPGLSDSVIGVQVRTRWNGADKRGVDDLDDAVFDLLHGMCNKTLTGGVHVVQCLRNSATTLGQDENERWCNSANYYVTVHRPSANRI